jgi:hypothetical protein
MLGLKQVLRRIPGLRPTYRYLRAKRELLIHGKRSPEVVFADIFRGNKFGGTESASGPGSELSQTRVVADELPAILRKWDVRTMLDIPCGDFHWMKHVNLEGIDYFGADIVSELIEKNKALETVNIHFRQLNMIEDKLPAVDLMFCRDCLVHLSFNDALLALRNICNSGSRYLFTTTFTGHQHNRDIITGQWRPLNLEAAPFLFPPPLMVINEGCTEEEGRFADKSLGMWRVSEIDEHLRGLPDQGPEGTLR